MALNLKDKGGIELTGTLFSSALGDAEDKLVYAQQVWDNTQKKHQSQINATVNSNDALLKQVAQDLETLENVTAGALVFKGTIGTGGTVTALPTNAKVGWSYKVLTAATYQINPNTSQKVEPGDMIICISEVKNAQGVQTGNTWTVVQENIDGAVTASSNFAAEGNIVVAAGSHRAVKDVRITGASGITTQYDAEGGEIVIGGKPTEAVAADKLKTARTITLTTSPNGMGVTGSTTFDGSSNKTIITTLNKVGLATLDGYTTKLLNKNEVLNIQSTDSINTAISILEAFLKKTSSQLENDLTWEEL